MSETLDVATRSLGALLQQHHGRHTRMCCSPEQTGLGQWDGVANRIQSQLRFLEGLLQRSSANNARIQKRDYASECFVAEKEALTACSPSQAFNAALPSLSF